MSDSTLPNFMPEALKYVEETDFIDDLNRDLAGNAFLAGAYLGYARGAKAVASVVQAHAEGGNIENFPHLSEKIEAAGGDS